MLSLYVHCIDSINKQTRIPDKIILVLNEYKKYKNDYDEIIKKYPECTYVKINTWEKPGINRNIGSEECIDGIIIYQDVDDIMHHQRCEFVEKCFDKYNCDLLLHECIQDYSSNKNNNYNLVNDNVITSDIINGQLEKSVNFFNIKNTINFSYHVGRFNSKGHSNLHHGQCCVKTKIIKENKNIWKNYHQAEDLEFVSDVTRKYKNTIVLSIPLVIVFGRDHLRLINNNVYHKKTQKKNRLCSRIR